MAAALRIGASRWSTPSWEGVFYPKGALPADYLPCYASEFDTAEVDATFYRTPSARLVDAWRERTPVGFLFAAKVPQVITHEKLLIGCEGEMQLFLKVMNRLGEKLGPSSSSSVTSRNRNSPSRTPFWIGWRNSSPPFPPALDSPWRSGTGASSPSDSWTSCASTRWLWPSSITHGSTGSTT